MRSFRVSIADRGRLVMPVPSLSGNWWSARPTGRGSPAGAEEARGMPDSFAPLSPSPTPSV